MTRDYIKEQMKEIKRITGLDFETFYLRYTSDDNHIISNKWGVMSKFEESLNDVEKSDSCIGDSLPIELLILINNRCVYCWTRNPLWDGANCPEEDSHVYTNVPLVGKHWFVDPIDWLDLDTRNTPMAPAFKRFFSKISGKQHR
jgi:hypothetical protein